ncbi:HI1506-related protein [Pseudomonas knackmussii]|uniref:HI1506-related protein n=1 Tax=Pseudomonas knackmussii TaxID=65741 RepID=UPI00136465D7|nr:HI1506-related protein [Pseudomonas knackmussii]
MGIRITARTDGFRRCGIAHSAKGKTYKDGFFSEEQLGALRAEPQLVVTEVVDGEDGEDEGNDENLGGAGGDEAQKGSASTPAAPAKSRPAAFRVTRPASAIKGKAKTADKGSAQDKSKEAPAGGTAPTEEPGAGSQA